ncbi:MAG: hypothetical protein IPM29_22380 [Planctomycetes bacterium]|nr:hypothetical protein [Planctomycetota bacterium]
MSRLPDSGQQGPAEPVVVRPASVDALRELLTSLVRVEIHVRRAAGDIDVDPQQSSNRQSFESDDTLRALRDGFAEPLPALDPAGWDWPQQIDLLLADGRRVRAALYPYDDGRRPGIAGLGDRHASVALARTLRQLVGSASWSARRAQGVATGSELAFDGWTKIAPVDGRLDVHRLTREQLADLPRFGRAERIVTLVLDGSAASLGHGWADALAPLPALRELRIRHARIDDDDLRALARHPQLDTLDLTAVGPRLTGAGFDAFADHPHLHRVVLDRAGGLSARGCIELARTRGPRELVLSDAGLGDQAVRAMLGAGAAGLRELDLSGNAAPTGAVFHELATGAASWQALELLDVRGTAIPAERAASFARDYGRDVRPLRVLGGAR